MCCTQHAVDRQAVERQAGQLYCISVVLSGIVSVVVPLRQGTDPKYPVPRDPAATHHLFWSSNK